MFVITVSAWVVTHFNLGRATIIVVSTTDTGAILANLIFWTLNPSTRIYRDTGSLSADITFWTGYTSTRINWIASAVGAYITFWTLNASTRIYADSVLASIIWIIANNAGTRVGRNTLTIDTSSSFTYYASTWIRRYASSILASRRWRTNYASTWVSWYARAILANITCWAGNTST